MYVCVWCMYACSLDALDEDDNGWDDTVVNPMYMYLAWWLLVVIGGVTASGEDPPPPLTTTQDTRSVC